MSDYHQPADFRDLPLFGDPEPTAKTPIARLSDPATSHQGADYIAPRRNKLASRMLEAFAEERTANEAAKWCVSHYFGNHESYRKRRAEIEDELTECGTRKCSVTGRPAKTFKRVQA